MKPGQVKYVLGVLKTMVTESGTKFCCVQINSEASVTFDTSSWFPSV